MSWEMQKNTTLHDPPALAEKASMYKPNRSDVRHKSCLIAGDYTTKR